MKRFRFIVSLLFITFLSANAFPDTKSIEELESECSGKNGKSCRELGNKYIFTKSKDHEKAIKYYREACSLNDADACRMLWIWHSQGKFHKISLNRAMAGQYRIKAERAASKTSDMDTAEASIQLGFDYMNGSAGLAKNKSKALRFFKYGMEYIQGQCSSGDSSSCKRAEYLLSSSSMSEFRSKISPEKEKSLTGGDPTADQKVFIKFLDAYVKSTSGNGGDTTAMIQEKQNRFMKAYSNKKISFRKLYLKNVDGGAASYIAGTNHCSYKATFYVPLKEGNPGTSDSRTRYKAPTVILEGICKKEALKYRKGQMYPVKGKLQSYFIYPPDQKEQDYIKKYFQFGGAVLNLKK